jgi:hypothetical protein
MEPVMTNIETAPAPGAAARARSEAPSTEQRMTDLLRRHPEIDEEGRRELIAFLKRGHPDELARAVYEHGLEARAVAFKKANPEHFASGLRAWLPWLGLLLGVLALIGLAHMI